MRAQTTEKRRAPTPTKSQLRDKTIRLRVRQLIDNGRLPAVIPKRILAGYGAGDLCTACGQPITNTQVVYDIEDDRCHGRPIFHMRCHALLQLECAMRAELN